MQLTLQQMYYCRQFRSAPVGGWLADKVGGIRMLMGLYGVVAIMMACISSLPPLGLIDVRFYSLE